MARAAGTTRPSGVDTANSLLPPPHFAVTVPVASAEMTADLLAPELPRPIARRRRALLARSARWSALMARSSRRAAEDMGEEFFNTVTHAIGLAASFAGLIYLLQAAISAGGSLRIASCTIYASTLVLLYASSTLMHYVKSARLKAQLRVADHVCIYLLIAGTYTPFLVTLVRGPVGWTMLGCVWIMALYGITTKFGGEKKLAEQSALPYVGLGWICVFGTNTLMATIPPDGLTLLLAGGISYSVGVIFFVRDDRRYFHAIWHLFVLAGSSCHFAAVLCCV